MSKYFDYETMNKNEKGKVASPVSLAWIDEKGNAKEYYINPAAQNIRHEEVFNNNFEGGWKSEYQGAYKVHKINSKELTGKKNITNGAILINTQEELQDMYDDFLNVTKIDKNKSKHKTSNWHGKRTKNIKNLNSEIDIVGFNNGSFDDVVLNEQIEKFGSTKAKAKLKNIKSTDVRREAFETLMPQGSQMYRFKAEVEAATGFKTTNEDLAKLLGIKVDPNQLHNAKYDINITKEIHTRLKSLNSYKEVLNKATNKAEFDQMYQGIANEFGNDILQVPEMRNIVKQAGQRGINVEEYEYMIKKRMANVKKIKKATEDTVNVSKSEKFLESAKMLKGHVNRFSDTLAKKGFSKKAQGIAGGVAVAAVAGKMIFGSNQEEQNKKLETLNERVNGSKGQYIEY